MSSLTVSAVAQRAGVSPHTIRYYDRLGLLPTDPRAPGDYRRYDPAVVDRVRFIRGAKRVGLRLGDIAELLEVMDRGQCPCGHTDALLRRRLTEIDTEIKEFTSLHDELRRLLDSHPPAACPDNDPHRWWCRGEFTERR